MEPLFLADLSQQCRCISPEFTAVLVQASVVRLSEQGHDDGAVLDVNGDFSGRFNIIWPYDVTDTMRRTWTEQRYTTDHAACGVALLLVHELTDLTVISRSWETTGFDYWLGTKDTPCDADIPFQGAVRLEISGIRKGNERLIRRRIKDKLRQTRQSDHLGLPAYVIVVEFSQPTSRFVEKKR